MKRENKENIKYYQGKLFPYLIVTLTNIHFYNFSGGGSYNLYNHLSSPWQENYPISYNSTETKSLVNEY